MRDYVRKIAQDKKKELWLTLCDKLKEELNHTEPTVEAIGAVSDDLDTVFSIWGHTFSEIDRLVDEYELVNQYQGACPCPKCGQWYNLFGQELINPQYWEEEDY